MYNQTAEAEQLLGRCQSNKAKWPELLGLITSVFPLGVGLPQSRLDHASGLSEFQHHRSGGLE